MNHRIFKIILQNFFLKPERNFCQDLATVQPSLTVLFQKNWEKRMPYFCTFIKIYFVYFFKNRKRLFFDIYNPNKIWNLPPSTSSRGNDLELRSLGWVKGQNSYPRQLGEVYLSIYLPMLFTLQTARERLSVHLSIYDVSPTGSYENFTYLSSYQHCTYYIQQRKIYLSVYLSPG